MTINNPSTRQLLHASQRKHQRIEKLSDGVWKPFKAHPMFWKRWLAQHGPTKRYENFRIVEAAKREEQSMSCRCSKVMVGGQWTGSLNWTPDCPEHGVESDWYKSPARADVRRANNERLRAMQAEAARVRNGGAPDPEFLERLDGRMTDG
jgi:hypothetical protein